MLVSAFESRPFWYLIRTKPRQERLAVELLESRCVPAYCPRVLEPRTHERAPRSPVPLFPSYVFARCALRDSYSAVNYCPGITGIVRFGDQLAAVEESDIDGLRAKEEGRGFLVLGSLQRVRPVRGSRVKIVAGPFKGFDGLVEQYLPSQERVRLLLKAVSGTWRAQMGANLVRVA